MKVSIYIALFNAIASTGLLYLTETPDYPLSSNYYCKIFGIIFFVQLIVFIYVDNLNQQNSIFSANVDTYI